MQCGSTASFFQSLTITANSLSWLINLHHIERISLDRFFIEPTVKSCLRYVAGETNNTVLPAIISYVTTREITQNP